MVSKLEDITSDIGASLAEAKALQRIVESQKKVGPVLREKILETLAFIVSHLENATS